MASPLTTFRANRAQKIDTALSMLTSTDNATHTVYITLRILIKQDTVISISERNEKTVSVIAGVLSRGTRQGAPATPGGFGLPFDPDRIILPLLLHVTNLQNCVCDY